MGLISELRRRNVFRMAALYVVAAWLIMQVAEVIITLGTLPAWTGQVLLLVLAVGFPIALIFSWLYELTPQGISLEKEIEPHESITHITGRRMDFIVIALLCAALLVFAADKWWPRGPIEQSIAVLPFVNLSDDPNSEYEYFADGIAEEILNTLTKVRGLHVTARTSSFSFKNKEAPIPEIANWLGVANILEGSVRISGAHLRITAQLVEARTGFHLWSNTWERELVDVFTIQDEIAALVVASLSLDDAPKAIRTDPQAYALFLKSKEALHRRTKGGSEDAVRFLEEALAIDPEYAEGWAALALVQVNAAIREWVEPKTSLARAEVSARRALSLDAENTVAMLALGGVEMLLRWNFEAAHNWFNKSHEVAPGSARVLNALAFLNGLFGQQESALALRRQAVRLDPLSLVYKRNMAITTMNMGRFEDAWSHIDSIKQLDLQQSIDILDLSGWLELLQGRPEEALAYAEQWSATTFPEVDPNLLNLRACALHGLGRFAEAQAEMDKVRRLDKPYAKDIARIYACWGEKEKAFEWLDRAYEERSPDLPVLRNNAEFQVLHDDPRWDALLNKLGLSDEHAEKLGL